MVQQIALTHAVWRVQLIRLRDKQSPIPITHIHLSILSQPTNTVSTTEHSGSSETASSPAPLAIFAIH